MIAAHDVRGCLVMCTQPLGSFPTQVCCCLLALLHLTVGKLSVNIFTLTQSYGLASTYAMLCHFCQNLVFVPVKEVNVQNADWLTDPSFIFNPDTDLVSVHQPSGNALEDSAREGCRVCAMVWFQLFHDAGTAYAHYDDDLEVGPILLCLSGISQIEDFEAKFPVWYKMKLRCGRRFGSLMTRKPLSGIIDEQIS